MSDPNSNRKKIYALEEQELYLHLYKASFDADSHFKLTGISSNGDLEHLENILKDTEIAILIMGVKTFKENVFNELSVILKGHAKLGVIVLMSSIGTDEAILIRKLLQKSRAGFAFYLKNSLDSTEQLNQIAHAVNHGQVVLEPAITSYVMSEKTEFPFLKTLTDRELEILNLLAQGYTNQAIAQTLFIDIKTVEHHLNSIYSKLREETSFNLRHPRVSVARIYLEKTGELIPFNPKTALPLYPS